MSSPNIRTSGQLQNDRPAVFFAYLWIIAFILLNLIQLICGLTWDSPGYSWRAQTIGELSGTGFPLNKALDYILVFQGAVIAVGVWAVKSLWRKSIFTTPARALLTLAGLGYIVTGLWPVNIDTDAYAVFGYAPILLFGSAGLIITCVAMNNKRFPVLWAVSSLLGIVSFLFGFLYHIEIYFGLGKGIMERIWIYMPLIWSVLIACSILRARANPDKYKPPSDINSLH